MSIADDSTAQPRATALTKSRVPDEQGDASLGELRAQLHAIWSGSNLRQGTTAVYVVDAGTGEELYQVHDRAPLNPASNVKLVSTATVLATLGPEWRFKTRVFGAAPTSENVIEGGVYLLGNYDPTLGPTAMQALATSLADQGVKEIRGDITIGEDTQRDTLGTSRVRVTVSGSAPGKAPSVEIWPASDMVRIASNKARTKKRGRSRVRLRSQLTEKEGQSPVLHLSLRGTIRRGHKRVLSASVQRRSSFTASVFKLALAEAGIVVSGDLRVASFHDFNAEAARAGRVALPLALHESRTMGSLVARVNKRSLNNLADRLVMTAAQANEGDPLDMGKAVALMKEWLASIGVDPESVVLDTGSGLSYRTKLSARQIVRVIRAAGGYSGAVHDDLSVQTFRDSLAIGGIDGTLRGRFRTEGSTLTSEMHGKTGTLTRVIALSGFLTRQDGRTLCFAIVTNGHRNRRKQNVRLEHEHMVASLDSYLGKAAPLIKSVTRSQSTASASLTPRHSVDDSSALDEQGASSEKEVHFLMRGVRMMRFPGALHGRSAAHLPPQR